MEVLRFTCSKCGEQHEGLPDMAFNAPMYFDQIPEAERERRAVLTSDTCVIDGEDFFVRGCRDSSTVPWSTTMVSFVQRIDQNHTPSKHFNHPESIVATPTDALPHLLS